MKNKSVLFASAMVALSAALCCAFTGCSGSAAAIVNGTSIKESEITEYIDQIRTSFGLTEQDAWGQYLASSQMTPSDVRDQVIETFVSEEIIKQEVKAEGITVDKAEIDSKVDQIKVNYETDVAWNQALQAAGLTESEYREQIEQALAQQQLQDKVAADATASEEETLSYATMYARNYDNGKRASHILFAAEDEQTASEVLGKLKSGELDFADAATQYSTDTASASQGGDLGWTAAGSSQYVENFQNALDGLGKGEMSDLVTTEYGIHIILCTDTFTAPKETNDDGEEVVKVTSLDQLPSDMRETVQTTVNDSAKNTAYQTWLQEKRDSAEVEIKEMPKNLPYDVDMSKYENNDEEEVLPEVSTETSTSTESDAQ